MPDPEISRRCSACGASIRAVALFCPQCGKELPQREAQSSSPLLAAELTSTKNTAPLENDEIASQQAMSQTMAIERPELPPDTIAIEPQPKSLSETIAVEKPSPSTKTETAPRVRGAVGTKLQRATTMARGVEGDVKHRVQKVRQISHVVIDEAGYDPSLRFVLVAAALFVLFLLIVLLNKIIT
jgi:zinc ribbon protein